MNSITVALISSIHNEFAKFAIEKTLAAVNCDEVITFTDTSISSEYKHVPIYKNFTRDDYSYFCLKNLWAFINTDYVLIIQYDGMAVNKSFWSDDFFNYDYIGAPWPEAFHWIAPHERVGNGGFSFRSRRLLEALRDPEIKIVTGNDRTENEDAVICQSGRNLLETRYSINYAPYAVASQFSQEFTKNNGKTLGFHGLWNIPLYFSEDEVCRYVKYVKKDYWDSYRVHTYLDNCRVMGYNNAYHEMYKKLYQ